MLKKVIFLVDMNAFFISCELTRRPELIGLPAAVAGDPLRRAGIILAANYEARAYGVKTAMVLHEALKLCPKMKIVPPDHHFYEQKSRDVMEILGRYTPVVEQNSIDEAWLDMTGCENLFGQPIESAKKIMDDIKNNLGLWCSVGIAENKFLSKMASDMKKPLGITELWAKDIPIKLWPLPVKSMYGIGAKTAEKLNISGINTIGELARFDTHILSKTFGKSANALHNHANGIDSSPVQAHSVDEMKSVGRSTTLPKDLEDIELAKPILLELSEDIGMSARKHGKKGRTVQITLKFSDFQSITRQTSLSPTYSTMEIYHAGCRLLEQNWKRSQAVRLIGISLTGFSDDCISDQISMFDTVTESSSPYGDKKIVETSSTYTIHQEIPFANAVLDKREKEDKIDIAMDKIKAKYGSQSITRAPQMKKNSTHD